MQNFPQSHPLFDGIDGPDLRRLIACLDGGAHAYERGEYVLRAGDPCAWVGIVCAGSAHVVQEDFWGNRVILGQSGPGQLFAESYACLGSENLTVSVVAAATTRVMFLDVGHLFQTCSTACGFHTRMIHNLTQVLAGRNLMLTQKVEHMAQKTTREKLLSYLSGEAQRAGSARFSIPYDRQELADYLSVDRSAMCTELSKLQRQGILRCRKKEFELLELPREF